MDALEKVDTETGELAIIPTIDPDVTLDVFTGLSETPVTKDQSSILLADANPDELDILPTGEVYPPQVMVRRRLMKAFGPAGWGMRPLSRPKITGNQIIQEWALYANGRFLSYTVGGADYQPTNSRLNWSDATESLKSNALVRLCKDLGMFSECWDHRWTENWKRTYAVKVFVTQKDNSVKAQWRRLDREPFYKETGATDDSPNKDKYKKPQATQKPAPQQTQKTTVSKPADNGSQPPKPEPVAPAPQTPVPTPAPAPEKEPVSELEQHFGTPSVTKQEAQKAETVKFWDGEKWVEKPAGESIKLATGTWFNQHFVGEKKAFENIYALFGQPSQKDITKRGHLGKHYGRTDFVNPKSAMSWREFAELVAYAWWQQGVRDEGKGTLSLPRYQDKLKEELDKQPAIPYEEPAKTSSVPSVEEVNERARKLAVDVLTLAQAAFGADTITQLARTNDHQRQVLWQVLDAVELGNVKADDFDGQLEMIMLG